MTDQGTHAVEALNKIETDSVKRIVRSEPDKYLSVVERLASDPNVDIDKLQRIIDMKHAEEDRDAEKEYNAAMALAQGSIKIAVKDKWNESAKGWYASEASVDKAINMAAADNGFSISFYEEDSPKESHIRVCADIMHSGGCTKKRYIDEPLDDKGPKGTVNKTGPHAKGSSLTYGMVGLKRMIFNVARGDDDDGNAAGGKVEYITGKELAHIVSLHKKVYTDPNDKNFFKLAGAKNWTTIPEANEQKVLEHLNELIVKKASKTKSERTPGQEG